MIGTKWTEIWLGVCVCISFSIPKVGCAASSDKQGDSYIVWLACDYNYGNMEDSPVYVAGDKASGCTTGANEQWTGLCKPDEPYAV